jgi:hypothetical protein
MKLTKPILKELTKRTADLVTDEDIDQARYEDPSEEPGDVKWKDNNAGWNYAHKEHEEMPNVIEARLNDTGKSEEEQEDWESLGKNPYVEEEGDEMNPSDNYEDMKAQLGYMVEPSLKAKKKLK